MSYGIPGNNVVVSYADDTVDLCVLVALIVISRGLRTHSLPVIVWVYEPVQTSMGAQY